MTVIARALVAASIASMAFSSLAAHDEGGETHAVTAPTAASGPIKAEESLPLDPRFSPERIKADVAFFADDLLEGRDIGSKGHEIAARYVAARFAALGLQPAGDMADGKRGFLQTIAFQKTTLVPAAQKVALTRTDGTTLSFDSPADAIITANHRNLDVKLRAPLVFVGYGLSNKALGLDDLKGLDLKGKIAVVLAGFPEGLPSEEAAYLVNTRARTLSERGAVGVVTVMTRASAAIRPWNVSQRYADGPRYTWVKADGEAHSETPLVEATLSLSDSAARALFAGARKSYDKVLDEAARKGSRPKAFALPGMMEIASKAVAERITSPNVVAILPGSDPVLKDEYVVLSGHLDHIGVTREKPGDAPGKDRINNGALDNAAGTATTLEVARVFSEAAQKPRRSLLFLVSTGEEKGLLGAGYFANNPTVPAGSIVGDVDLDMPLLLYPFTDVVAYGGDHSTLGPVTAKALAPMGVSLAPDPMPQETIFVRSDHYQFVKKGIPAVFLSTGYANGGAAQWDDFFKNRYHQPGDDMAQAINWRAGARFAEANWRITDAMANADTPPRWFDKDFFGEVFAPGAPRAPKK